MVLLVERIRIKWRGVEVDARKGKNFGCRRRRGY